MTSLLLELPTELINLIVEHAYYDGGRLIRAILPLSLVCKALRCAVKPFLFASMKVETEGCYVREYERPRWLYHDGVLSLTDLDPRVIDLVADLKFVCWRRFPKGTYTVRSWAFPEHLLGVIGEMWRLQKVSFAPPHVYACKILKSLMHMDLHIVFDYRYYEPKHPSAISDVTCHPDSTWSIASSFGSQSAFDISCQFVTQLKAFQWNRPIDPRITRTHVELLNRLHEAQLLEELHISERMLDLHAHLSLHPSYAYQICGLVSTLPSLRRIRIEGATLTGSFLAILPNIKTLQDLSIYSVYRRVFHERCDGVGGIPGPTIPMPWLELPSLRSLDLRFVCKHFEMQQLIPKGLLALRIEFYGAEERLNAEDVDWLARNCPDLERLELDIGPLDDRAANSHMSEESLSLVNEETDILPRLRGFRKLRTLRLFPSYWRNDKLLPHPFESGTEFVTSAVKLYLRLLSVCPNLQTVIISISFGEYPFDVVSKMWLTTRPAKFILRSAGRKDDVLVQWGYAAHHEMYELLFKGDTALPGIKNVPSSEQYFFDDLNEDWILPHYELHKNIPSP